MIHNWYYIFRNRFLFTVICSLTVVAHLNASPEHTEIGTQYGEQGIAIYDKTRHGPDGNVFLDPFFVPYLCDMQEQTLIDAGCGTGPWAIFAAQHGALVWGIDIQEGMIEKAKKASIEAGLQLQTNFVVGDTGHLPYATDFFDRAISINVGCNLPELRSHIKELYRVLKNGSSAIITAPTSFGTVFTNGEAKKENVIQNITQALAQNDNVNGLPSDIPKMDEVYRATFANREGKWILILDENELKADENIWRKLPNMVVPNRYHSEKEYLTTFLEEGFIVKSISRPHFANEQERIDFNVKHKQTLGEDYVQNPPFIIFVIEKSE